MIVYLSAGYLRYEGDWMFVINVGTHAHHGDLADSRVILQHVLDLSRIDEATPKLDDLLDPVAYIDLTVLVVITEIAAVYPACARKNEGYQTSDVPLTRTRNDRA